MVVNRTDKQMQELVTDSLIVLCKAKLSYHRHFKLEGLLAITLDDNEVVIVNVNDIFSNKVEKVEQSSNQLPHTVVSQYDKRPQLTNINDISNNVLSTFDNHPPMKILNEISDIDASDFNNHSQSNILNEISNPVVSNQSQTTIVNEYTNFLSSDNSNIGSSSNISVHADSSYNDSFNDPVSLLSADNEESIELSDEEEDSKVGILPVKTIDYVNNPDYSELMEPHSSYDYKVEDIIEINPLPDQHESMEDDSNLLTNMTNIKTSKSNAEARRAYRKRIKNHLETYATYKENAKSKRHVSRKIKKNSDSSGMSSRDMMTKKSNVETKHAYKENNQNKPNTSIRYTIINGQKCVTKIEKYDLSGKTPREREIMKDWTITTTRIPNVHNSENNEAGCSGQNNPDSDIYVVGF